ncbi:UNVERIFIED_ORG: 5-methylcytosine-specific restriction protein A [Burkholderia sp. CF145]
MPRTTITEAQIVAAHDVASDVWDGKLSSDDGADVLANSHGLNRNSALNFIADYGHMMRGENFQRAMSAPAVDYFLNQIRETRGTEALKSALVSMRLHVEYYEGVRKVHLASMRAVISKHERSSSTPSLSELATNFQKQVAAALDDSPEKRRARLQAAARVPKKIAAVTEVYVRNPDVVAEVLYRARGACERCGQNAPFVRRSDGTPYLEVHHKTQLAHGGEDAVENAQALCPNCHRELHFGFSTGSQRLATG